TTLGPHCHPHTAALALPLGYSSRRWIPTHVRYAGGGCLRIGPVAAAGQRQGLGHLECDWRPQLLWPASVAWFWVATILIWRPEASAGAITELSSSASPRIATKGSAVTGECLVNLSPILRT